MQANNLLRLPHELFKKRERNIMGGNDEKIRRILKQGPGLIYREE
jgi:hypothetical protein